MVAFRDTEVCSERDAEPVTEAERERMKVGVSVTEGKALLSVGMTRELAPKKGALPGSNIGPVSAFVVLVLLRNWKKVEEGEERTNRALRKRNTHHRYYGEECAHHLQLCGCVCPGVVYVMLSFRSRGQVLKIV